MVEQETKLRRLQEIENRVLSLHAVRDMIPKEKRAREILIDDMLWMVAELRKVHSTVE